MVDIASDMIGDGLGTSPRSLRKRIGRRARTARLASRRSQADVARAAGVSVPTVQRFEAGANVSLDVLARVAITLGAERDLRDLFALPDARTIDEVLARKQLPKRGRDVTRRDLLAVSDEQSINSRRANAIIDEVAAAVEQLPSIASTFGVTRATLRDVKTATGRQLSLAVASTTMKR